MAPRPNWKGYLKLSLVSCAIALYPATSDRERVSFNQLNKNTGNRIRYKKVREDNGEEVEFSDIAKAYESEDGETVVAEWAPAEQYEAFPGMLNGGIVGALLDCHSNWAAAYHFMKRDRLPRPPCTVTADYAVKLLRPTPTDGPVTLTAHVVESNGDRATVEAFEQAAAANRHDERV